ncbi:uncharacterized protein [Coffea arabica]|uniref:Endonuclease/exonuclease/phosphatase domain-containing protein n=1 Tax=Coffea arabica TaxID=13443 RepID=A0ABM4U5I0_COFAR
MVVHLRELLLCSAMIKSLFWNARGVDNALMIARLGKLKRMHHISLIALCELLVGREHLDVVPRKLGFPFGVSNDESRIWLFFDAEYECDIAVASPQFLAVKITHSYFQCSFLATFIHASCALDERELFWQQLLRVSQMGVPTIFLGDFNVIASAEEKKGGRPFWFGEADSFLNFTEGAALTDLGSGPHSFRFLGVWRSHGEFINVVWNKEVFGNITDRIREGEEWVLALEGSLETNPSEEGECLLTQAQCDLKETLLREARYWRQKACVRWLKEWDANTRFFHAQVKQ